MKQKERLIAKIVSSIERVITNDNSLYTFTVHMLGMLPQGYQSPHTQIRKEINKLIGRRNDHCLKFVQIGCYDGKTGDPLFPFIVKNKWTGVLVEPFPDSFEKLKKSYQGCSGLNFENIAIANSDGISTLYWSNQANKKFWHDQTFSLLRAHHKDLVNLTETDHVLEYEVCSYTLSSLFIKYNIKDLDVFCVDVEGFDDQIILQLLKLEIRPRLIIYEHSFLNEQTQKLLLEMLSMKSYRVVETAIDTLAILET